MILARIDSNRQKFNRKKVDLSLLVDSVNELASQKEISIATNVKENTIIYADEALLLSNVTNLISNAIKYGRESGAVIITVSKSKDYADIIVTDNGIGISNENIDKI